MSQDLEWLQTQIGRVLKMVDCPKVLCPCFFMLVVTHDVGLTSILWNVLAVVDLHDRCTRVKRSGLTLIKRLEPQEVFHRVHFVLSCSG